MIPHNLKRNAFLDDLGDDWVGVDANGHVVCRAESEAAVRHAAPNAVHFLNAAHLGDTAGLPIAAAALSATDAALEQIKAQSQPPAGVEADPLAPAEGAYLRRGPPTPEGLQTIATTAKPPTAKPAKAQPPAKSVKVPARHPTSAPKRTGK